MMNILTRAIILIEKHPYRYVPSVAVFALGLGMTIVFSRLAGGMENKDLRLALMTGGVLFAGFASSYIMLLTDRMTRARRDAEEISKAKQSLEAETEARNRMEARLLETEDRQKAILDNIPDIAWLKDGESRFIAVNEPFGSACGFKPETLVGKTDLDIWPSHLAEIYRADDREVMATGKRKRVEEPLVNRDGLTRWIETIKTPIFNGRGEAVGTTGISRDITERKQAEEKLKRQAFYDALTGLPNRAMLTSRLDRLVGFTKKKKDFLFAVLFLDLDGFKLVNDSLGHMAGDRLLADVARRLENHIRPGDMAARLGGDEFAILLEGLGSFDTATDVAVRVIKTLKEPFSLDGQEVFISASIGIAVSSAGYDCSEEVIRDADTAMYRAKSLGRARFEIFDRSMHDYTVDRIEIETDLRRALERGEMLVYYQPIVALDTEHIIGMEALARWQSRSRGLMCPDKFIPVAEETGLLTGIGGYVLKEACAQNRKWRDEGRNFRMAVNISPRHIGEGLVDEVKDALEAAGMPPDSLEVEIIESFAMKGVSEAVEILGRLKAMGVWVSIDDFGTGYSSLGILKRLPVNTLKIGQAFTGDLTTDGDTRKLARAIIDMAHGLGLGVIAEAVETEEQLAFLRSIRCDAAQGFIFSKALPAEDITRLLREGSLLSRRHAGARG